MSPRLLTTLLAVLPILAACGPRVPATRPTPSPTPATPGSPAARVDSAPALPVPVPVTGGASSWTVAYAPGFAEYLVTSQAAVHVEGDTLPPMDDSVATRVRLSMRLSPESAPLGVIVTVDSFLVSARRGAPLAPAIAYPLALQAQIDTAHRRIDFLPDQSMLGQPCAGPGATLLALARELTVALPAPLERGRQWTETTTHQLCRSGVPLTVTSEHQWTVDGEVEVAGRTLVRLRRETRGVIVGTGSGRRAGASVEGTSRAQAEYLLDPVAGRLQSAVATSQAELRLRERADAPVLTSRQDARQEAVLLVPAAR